jgi:hypothetical protein
MIRRGTFLSVRELEQAIYDWLAKWNRDPQPFVWKATSMKQREGGANDAYRPEWRSS